MIILGVIIKAYTIMTFATVFDEAWNIQHPRPYPKQHYYMMQWEEEDFIKMRDGSYKLRVKCKTDSELKKHARDNYNKKKDLFLK